MILTTHAVVGAAAGRLFPQNPIMAFLAGFISHFVLDAIPHWHYKISSYAKNPENPLENDMVIGKPFIKDLFNIGIDGLLGVTLSIYFFQGSDGFFNPSISTLAGALGGLFPDLLQFAYWKIRKEPLKIIQRFHLFIHAKNHVRNLIPGVIYQVLIIIIAILMSKFII